MKDLTYVVLIKQVLDMDEVDFIYEEGQIDRSSATLEPNPFDLNALEEAVKYKEELGGKVIAISMGPGQAESTLRDALARGADRAILLTGPEFAGSDTWATSLALGGALNAIGGFDLIFCGEKTVDGDTGQVGPEVSEFLDIPHSCFVSNLQFADTDEGVINVESGVWGATYVKEIFLPALITVTKDINEPRLPSFKDKMKAKQAEIERWDSGDIDINPEVLGIKGSPTYVADTEIPPPDKREAIILREEAGDAVTKLLRNVKLGGT